ncbi:MAG: hypothetical protein EHM87_24640 [Burkholderiales bacterium]|nr:MAG: hypothetical protein EHM87_24640 [Burkholderiales bacterium]
MHPSPFVVNIGNSRRLRLYLAAAHMSCAFGLVLAALPPFLQWTGLVLLSGSLVHYWRRDQSARVRGDQAGKFEIRLDEKWRVARLADACVIWPSCTVLRFAVEPGRRKRNLVVMPDSLPEEDYRRLRVWLRWRGGKPDSNKADIQ